MARYKLTKTEESQGDKHFYSIECIDEWDGILVSWDYKKLDGIQIKGWRRVYNSYIKLCQITDIAKIVGGGIEPEKP